MTGKHISQTGILQLGAKNKNGYRWVLSADWRSDFKKFLSVKDIWHYEFGVDEPPVIDLPKTLKL